jgi:hypothetical protein
LEYPDTALSLKAVVSVICRELAQAGSPANLDVAVAVLGNLAATRPKSVTAVEHANRCLQHVHTADLQQYLVLPTPCRPDYEATFGELQVRPFDPERLLYWSRRGGSTYPTDVSQLAGKTTLLRERFSTCLVNWDALPLESQQAVTAKFHGPPEALRDAYYSAVFEHHMKEIPSLLRRDLLALEAGALVHFDVESLFNAPLARRLGLFHWLSAGAHRTWAVLSWVGALTINLTPPNLLTECRRWVKDIVGFAGLNPAKPLDKAVETFCTFLQRAHDHRLRGRGDEAALHFVIALDLVLGLEGRSAESVAERAAVVTHRPLGQSMQDQVRRVKQLYDSRSKYVHEGRPFSSGDIEEAERVATQVLWALLAVSGAGVLSSTSEWLKKVNYVAAALKDGRALPDAEFTALGVVGAEVRGAPPNRVLEDPYEGMGGMGARASWSGRRS